MPGHKLPGHHGRCSRPLSRRKHCLQIFWPWGRIIQLHREQSLRQYQTITISGYRTCQTLWGCQDSVRQPPASHSINAAPPALSPAKNIALRNSGLGEGQTSCTEKSLSDNTRRSANQTTEPVRPSGCVRISHPSLPAHHGRCACDLCNWEHRFQNMWLRERGIPAAICTDG